MMANNEEEIFYSDDDLSDSELYQVICNLFAMLLLKRSVISILEPILLYDSYFTTLWQFCNCNLLQRVFF